MTFKDKIKGGIADKKKPKDFNPKALADGIKVELEHTKDRKIAMEIAMDHLSEDPQYYTKLKTIHKEEDRTRLEVSPDGKREFDYGSEDLNKLKDKWDKLKKALNHDKAFKDIKSQEFDDTSDIDGSDQQPEQGEGNEPPQDQPDPSQEQPQEPQPDPSQDQGEEQEQPQDPTANMSEEEKLQLIEKLLEEEGYAPAEIAHIIHNHNVPGQTVDDIKVDSESAMAQHKLDHTRRMNDLEHAVAQKEHETNDLDRSHKERMLELEYDYARKQKEFELDMKRKEAELKLKQMEEKHKKSIQISADQSRSQDAAKTSSDEKKGK
jgi:hypothetical protein